MRDRQLNALASQIENAAATKASEVAGAELVRVSSTAGIRATDPIATIASQTRSSIVEKFFARS